MMARLVTLDASALRPLTEHLVAVGFQVTVSEPTKGAGLAGARPSRRAGAGLATGGATAARDCTESTEVVRPAHRCQ